jgi:Holliday junction resolvasome RuvABC DNA-binding subunit
MRLALILHGQGAKARTDGETIWADPETRNEAARTDSVLKQVSFGLPFQFALEEMGYSQTQIERILKLKAEEDAQRKIEEEAKLDNEARRQAMVRSQEPAGQPPEQRRE